MSTSSTKTGFGPGALVRSRKGTCNCLFRIVEAWRDGIGWTVEVVGKPCGADHHSSTVRYIVPEWELVLVDPLTHELDERFN